MAITKLVRVELPGTMVYWMSASGATLKDPIGHARTRVRLSMTSHHANKARAEIDPGYRARFDKFANSRRLSTDYKVTYHSLGGRAPFTRDINIHELFAAAGKPPPLNSAIDITVDKYRKACLETSANS